MTVKPSISCEGTPARDGEAVRFAYECSRTWESLAPTEDPTIRRCDACDQTVHFCTDLVAAAAHAKARRCVALITIGIRAAPRRPKSLKIPSTFKVPTRVGSLAYDGEFRAVGWLVPLDGPQRGQLLTLAPGVTTIGCDTASQVRIDDECVQGEHCRIVSEQPYFNLIDGCSDIGTYVNGSRVDKAELLDGDLILVGATRIVFKSIG